MLGDLIMKKNEIVTKSLVWFGAATSIAEIITGTYFAPLGFAKGLLAILIGHIIGAVLFFLAGFIGATSKKTAMQTVELSFGSTGAKFFAILNVIQLIGWTSIMIYDASSTIACVFNISPKTWGMVIGALIFIWILCGVKDIENINKIIMSLLFILSIVLFAVIIKTKNAVSTTDSNNVLSFGAAIELAVAMPLSWLPLVSDYTYNSEKPVAVTIGSTLSYILVSTWMYTIGMATAIFTSETNIASILLKAGLGIAALIIVILSTVSTTFLDAYSSGVSCKLINEKANEKNIGLVVAVIGTVLAVLFNMDNISNFLYFIGSVFTPMIAILITDYFLLKKDNSQKKICTKNLIIWTIGFILYRFLMRFDIPIGNSIPDVIIVMLIDIIVQKLNSTVNSKFA